MDERKEPLESPITGEIPAAEPAAEISAPPKVPAEPPKVRRVGTFSLGITLVAIGAILLAAIFLPNLDIIGVLKFAPIVLIVLGVEILIYAARPDVKIKYDGISIFLSILLVLACGAAGTFSWAWQAFGPEANAADYAVRQELEAKTESVLDEVPNARNMIHDYSLDTSYSTQYSHFLHTGQYLTGDDAVTLYVTMNLGVQKNAEEFVRDCKAIVDACEASDLNVNSYLFDVWQGDSETYEGELWSLSLDGWSAKADEATILARTRTWYCSYGSTYDSEEDFLAAQKERETERLRDLYRENFESDPYNDYEAEIGNSPSNEQVIEYIVRRLDEIGVATAESAVSET